MTCDKCSHCRRVAERLRNPKVKVPRKPRPPKPVEPFRTCLNCNVEKKIDDYSKTTNSNSRSVSYRKTCKKCIIIKQRDYMKAYHKKYYVSQKRPRDENGKIIDDIETIEPEKNNI